MEKSSFKVFINYVKDNPKKYLINIGLVTLSTLFGLLYQPFYRSVSKVLGIFVLVIFLFFSFCSMLYIWFRCIKSNKYDSDFKFIFYFSSIIVSGVIFSLLSIILKFTVSNKSFLSEGFVGICSVVVYYLLLGVVIFFLESKEE